MHAQQYVLVQHAFLTPVTTVTSALVAFTPVAYTPVAYTPVAYTSLASGSGSGVLPTAADAAAAAQVHQANEEAQQPDALVKHIKREAQHAEDEVGGAGANRAETAASKHITSDSDASTEADDETGSSAKKRRRSDTGRLDDLSSVASTQSQIPFPLPFPATPNPKRKRGRGSKSRSGGAVGLCSQFRGVSWHKRDKKWLARKWVNNRIEHLGTFQAEAMAALAVDLRTVEHFGQHTCKVLNFPDADERARMRCDFEATGDFTIKCAADLDGPGHYRHGRRNNRKPTRAGASADGAIAQPLSLACPCSRKKSKGSNMQSRSTLSSIYSASADATGFDCDSGPGFGSSPAAFAPAQYVQSAPVYVHFGSPSPQPGVQLNLQQAQYM